MTEKLQHTDIVCAPPAPARNRALPKTLQSRINVLAHKQAALHEQEFKASKTKQLQALLNEGKSLPEVLTELRKIEAEYSTATATLLTRTCKYEL